jgi:hypothetical protein
MVRRFPVFLILAIASACDYVPGAAIYPAALKGVERVAAEYLVETHPALPLRASVVCMTNAMTQVEVVQMGIRNDLTLTPRRRAVFEAVEDRPKAANCLAALGETTA